MNGITPKVIGALSLAMLGSVFAPSSADALEASTWKYHGALCAPKTSTDAGRITFERFGARNSSTTATASVECGASFPGDPAFSANEVTQVGVVVFDRSTTANVSCTLMLLDSGGVIISSANRNSTGSGSSFQSLLFNPPAGNVTTNVDISCTIPAETATGSSHVAMYFVTTAET